MEKVKVLWCHSTRSERLTVSRTMRDGLKSLCLSPTAGHSTHQVRRWTLSEHKISYRQSEAFLYFPTVSTQLETSLLSVILLSVKASLKTLLFVSLTYKLWGDASSSPPLWQFKHLLWVPGASQRANPPLKRRLMGLNFSTKQPASGAQPRKIDPFPLSGAVMWILGSLCLMGSLELVGGVASLHFSGVRGSWLTGRTEWERRDCTRLPAANSGKVEDSRHAEEEPWLWKTVWTIARLLFAILLMTPGLILGPVSITTEDKHFFFCCFFLNWHIFDV